MKTLGIILIILSLGGGAHFLLLYRKFEKNFTTSTIAAQEVLTVWIKICGAALCYGVSVWIFSTISTMFWAWTLLISAATGCVAFFVGWGIFRLIGLAYEKLADGIETIQTANQQIRSKKSLESEKK